MRANIFTGQSFVVENVFYRLSVNSLGLRTIICQWFLSVIVKMILHASVASYTDTSLSKDASIKFGYEGASENDSVTATTREITVVAFY